MNYYSTNNRSYKVGLRDAVLKSLAPDKGLYMPENFNSLSKSFIDNLRNISVEEIAFEVSRIFFQDDIPDSELLKITSESINFPIPLVFIHDNIFSLELFHGPTMAFKDVGARFMARMLSYFSGNIDQEIHVLVATSGDTGSAVANGFLGIDGIRVHVLYPKGKVSPAQEKQFTTLNRNIRALEVEGSFDDCQSLVKEAFNDPLINKRIMLTSANSINLARLLPQSIYYFIAVNELPNGYTNPVICVPSGNFGNLTAGLIGKKIGLPVRHFIAATNINDIVPQYLKTGEYKPGPSRQTIANAMDVGDPSNFARILDLYNYSYPDICKDLTAFSYNDTQLAESIRNVYNKYAYLKDPHGSAGYLGVKDYLQDNQELTGIFLETAHPAKFAEIVEEITGHPVPVPDQLKKFMSGRKNTIQISKNYNEFRDYLASL